MIDDDDDDNDDGGKWRRLEREKGKGELGKKDNRGLETTQSFQSFLMLRFHSQDRWSCLSSSVNLDLML